VSDLSLDNVQTARGASPLTLPVLFRCAEARYTERQ